MKEILADEKNDKKRNSSIELLKVIGIILIVISHVIQTLHTKNTLVGIQDYVINLSTATNNIQYLILAMLRSSGAFGNTIFFVCSAWFLLDSNKVNKKKILQILMDIFVISILLLVIVYLLRDGNIGLKMIIKQIFPTIFENNWYMTCYLLFYPIHPILNIIINKLDKKILLRNCIIMSILYIGINYLHPGHFFVSPLILWTTIYFVIGYMKKYLPKTSNNLKINLIAFTIGFIGNYGIIFLTNFMGLHIELFSEKILRWGINCSPFIILMSISLLNIARNIHIENRIVNYISKLSLLIYIIHENILLRTYYRPLMWQWVYKNIGYDYILFWMIVIVGIVFVFGLVASIIYKNTLQKCVTKIIDYIYPKLCNIFNKIENVFLKLK